MSYLKNSQEEFLLAQRTCSGLIILHIAPLVTAAHLTIDPIILGEVQSILTFLLHIPRLFAHNVHILFSILNSNAILSQQLACISAILDYIILLLTQSIRHACNVSIPVCKDHEVYLCLPFYQRYRRSDSTIPAANRFPLLDFILL